MDVVTRNLERAFALFVNLFSSTNHFLIVTAAGFLFLIGLFLLYKKGPWLGVPFSLGGMLLVITAILFKMFSS